MTRRGRSAWTAPSEDGGYLVDPPWPDLATYAQGNAQQRLQQSAASFAGSPWGTFHQRARRELVTLAARYSSTYVPNLPADDQVPLFVTGHQPQLFHPGVWFKNFLISRLAAAHHGLAVHLLIDNDLLRVPAIPVPSGTRDDPSRRMIAFDAPAEPQPYEQRRVLDADLFASFGKRVEQAMRPMLSGPMITRFWPDMVARVREEPRIGWAIAQARHKWERQWGEQTLELPLSVLCDGECFLEFVADVLLRAGELAEHYNRAILQYRAVHHLRSRTHPAPLLREEDGWIEMPFWIGEPSQAQRRGLWVRRTAAELAISDSSRRSLVTSAPRFAALCEALQAARGEGIRIRPRALMTTLYARLAVSDLFVHGIGGAKYDEVTDQVIERFLGVSPPGFAVATATLRLPLDAPTGVVDQQRNVAAELRRLEYHPETFLDGSQAVSAAAESLVRQKRQAIAWDPPREERGIRHRQIVEVNTQLARFLQPLRNELETRLEALEAQRRRHQVLAARDYAFCLFAEDDLRRRMGQVLERARQNR